MLQKAALLCLAGLTQGAMGVYLPGSQPKDYLSGDLVSVGRHAWKLTLTHAFFSLTLPLTPSTRTPTTHPTPPPFF